MNEYLKLLREVYGIRIKEFDDLSNNMEQIERIEFSDSFKRRMNDLFSSHGMRPPHPEVEKE